MKLRLIDNQCTNFNGKSLIVFQKLHSLLRRAMTFLVNRQTIFVLVCGSLLGFSVAIMTVMSLSATYEDRPIIIYNAAQQAGSEVGSLSDTLYKKVKVLCWVMTNPANHQTKARAVRQTWGPRCNKLLFMSTEADGDLQPVVLPFTEGRDQLWNKTREAFKHVYDHYLEEFDWFLKADDDT